MCRKTKQKLVKTTITLFVTCILSFSANLTTAESQTLSPVVKKKVNNNDFKPDPTKRLTLEAFVKGATRLNIYLENAIEKAIDADKKFLTKEKAELESQLKNPEVALSDLFENIDFQIKRLRKDKLFSPDTISQMRMHYLDTEAGKVVGLLQNEEKKSQTNNAVQAEIQYQLGIIAHRDQVNYKSALAYFGTAVKHSPDNLEYLTAFADLNARLENNSDAKKQYQAIILLMMKNSASENEIKKIKSKIALMK